MSRHNHRLGQLETLWPPGQSWTPEQQQIIVRVAAERGIDPDTLGRRVAALLAEAPPDETLDEAARRLAPRLEITAGELLVDAERIAREHGSW